METIISILEGIKPGVAIDENTRLLDEKILDSMAMISLVAELTDEFDVDISATDTNKWAGKKIPVRRDICGSNTG